jgi:hypothetical protein
MCDRLAYNSCILDFMGNAICIDLLFSSTTLFTFILAIWMIVCIFFI